MSDEKEVRFELTCVEMPDTATGNRTQLRLGIQQNKLVVDDVPADTDPAVFRFSLRVQQQAKSGQPNFLGPFAHGTPAERFVYLCWGERVDGEWNGHGRVKVQLKDLSWDRVRAAIQSNTPMRATIRMQDKKGRPLTASVKSEQITWA